MIHVDEVIELFSEHYPDAEVDASADKVDAVITSNGLSVKVTFIERTQVFNLDNGRGKVYTATNFEALQSNIETFFYMENDFKPKSQAVCSVFKNAFLKDSTVVRLYRCQAHHRSASRRPDHRTCRPNNLRVHAGSAPGR